jgi:hypothetical protein
VRCQAEVHPLRSDKELGYLAAFALFCVLLATAAQAVDAFGVDGKIVMWSDQATSRSDGLTKIFIYGHNDIESTLRLPLYPLVVIGALALAGMWLNIAFLAPRPAHNAPRALLVGAFVIDLLLVPLAALQWFEFRSGCDDLARGWNDHVGGAGGDPFAMVCVTTQYVTGATQDQMLETLALVVIAGFALLATWCNLTGLAQDRRANRLLREGAPTMTRDAPC